MQQAKNIEFTVILTGHGSPNKEGSEGKIAYNQYVTEKNALIRSSAEQSDGNFLQKQINDNVNFLKSNYYKGGKRIIKLSGDCIRHAIFNAINNPATKEDITALIEEDASVTGILRGYLNPSKTDITTKRKSPLTVTDAELDNDAVPQFEVHSVSGPRTDTSFFVKESIGETRFKFTVRLDLSELSVLSCCDTMDRPCVRPDLKPLFEQKLKDNGLSFKQVALRKANSVQAEVCYVFDDETVNKMVNYLIKQIQQIDIYNATEYVQFESMTAKVTTGDGTRKTVAIENGELVEKFEVKRQYVEASLDEALAAEKKVRECLDQTKKKDKGSSKSKSKAKSEESSSESK